MKTIEELESHLEGLLNPWAVSEFPGHRIRVSLFDKKTQRKKRKDASAEYWKPGEGEIRICFEPDTEVAAATATPATPPIVEPKPSVPRTSHLAELVRALNNAESRPGYGFVALKWFRDQVLPAVRPEWSEPETRTGVLREAIEKGLVLTNKVPNPKSPAFPVTAVRVNRSLPETAEILGTPPTSPEEFHPIGIRGEELSETVRRERR